MISFVPRNFVNLAVRVSVIKSLSSLQKMLLLYMTVSCLLFGSSTGMRSEELCYGRTLRFPYEYQPPFFSGKLYFTPSNGGPRRLVMDNGEAKQPRIIVSRATLQLTDLNEKDDGTYSVSFTGSTTFDIVRLKILDCANEVTRNYGDTYFIDVSRQAEFLEFTPLHIVDQTTILWNRTNPQTTKGGRGQMNRNVWQMKSITQADNGYYNFRKKDNTLLSRILLKVEEYSRHYHTKVDERLFIRNPSSADSWTVTFTPKGKTKHYTLVKAGSVVSEDGLVSDAFIGRINVRHDGMELDPVEYADSGTFEFRDPQGNLAQTVHVEVSNVIEAPVYAVIAILVGIVFLGIVCCCCVRKSCCKKSSSKRDESAAAPAVYHHDHNQPAAQSYSAAPATDYSYQPANPIVSREPATTSLGPTVYNPVNIHVNSPQPEVAAPGGQGAAPAFSLNSDCLFSDTDPKFELKGLTFPSAPPLSSDTAFCDVYTSDKLNFL